MASPDHPLLASLAELRQDKLIEDGHRHWARLMAAQGLGVPAGALTFNQTALAIDAAIAGQGVALAPRILAADALGSGQLAEIWQARDTGDAFHLLHPDTPHPARDRVIGWLADQVG